MPRPSHRIGLALLLFLLLGPSPSLSAQVEEAPPEAAEPVRFYMDCRATGCDANHIRVEIQFVDHVRDIRDSDVYLLATSQSTGAGGRSSELIFEGRGRFEGMTDTLTYISAFDATRDEIRDGFTRMVKIGLLRYVGLTPLAERLEITFRKPGETALPGRPGPTASPEDDPWDFWVFRIRASGGLTGRSNYESMRFSGSLSANRVTEDWKVTLSLSQSYYETVYDYPEIDYHQVSIRRDHTFAATLVKSIAEKWSAGVKGTARNATYYNFDFAGSLAPVIEYSVFPYEEATRRSLAFQYAVEGVYHDYREQTVYFKDHERFVTQSLSANLNLQRRWGNAFAAVEAAHRLDDVDLHHLSFFTGLSLRLGRGLTLTISGDASRIQDLTSVAADAGDTVEEILLARKQLQTDYRYSTSISLSYSFGSIFNNIVNPRLGGGGSGVPIIIY